MTLFSPGKDDTEVISVFGALALACLAVYDWLVQEGQKTYSGSQPNPSGIASRNGCRELSLLHRNASVQIFIWN
jgi:hypothetical protein